MILFVYLFILNQNINDEDYFHNLRKKVQVYVEKKNYEKNLVLLEGSSLSNYD